MYDLRKVLYFLSPVGSPIDVPHLEEPDQATIDKYHQLYMDQLSDLFDSHKTNYGVEADKKLEFV